MLRIHERRLGDVVIVDVDGRIAAGGASELTRAIEDVVLRGHRKVVLNLAAAMSSDASGVSACLGALLSAMVAGAELRLMHVTRRISDLCIIAALYRYFAVFDSEEAAVASFEPPPEPFIAADASGWFHRTAA